MFTVVDCTSVPDRELASFSTVVEAKHYLNSHAVSNYEAVTRFEVIDNETGVPVHLEVFLGC